MYQSGTKDLYSFGLHFTLLKKLQRLNICIQFEYLSFRNNAFTTTKDEKFAKSAFKFRRNLLSVLSESIQEILRLLRSRQHHAQRTGLTYDLTKHIYI